MLSIEEILTAQSGDSLVVIDEAYVDFGAAECCDRCWTSYDNLLDGADSFQVEEPCRSDV